MNKKTWTLAVGLGLLGAGTAAHAALIDTGNGLINDTTLSLVWIKDANLAVTQSFGVTGISSNGTMNWAKALEWIAAMNTANYSGYNDWRLWQLSGNGGCTMGYHGTNCGYNVNTATSEMASLWYDTLGNIAYSNTSGVGPQSGWGLSNTGPFANMQASVYWSGTEFAQDKSAAWVFDTGYGYQDGVTKDYTRYAWAVRSGQIADAPLPGTALLMALGLAGLWTRRQGRQATLFIRRLG
jgi:hypothetical protein